MSIDTCASLVEPECISCAVMTSPIPPSYWRCCADIEIRRWKVSRSAVRVFSSIGYNRNRTIRCRSRNVTSLHSVMQTSQPLSLLRVALWIKAELALEHSIFSAKGEM